MSGLLSYNETPTHEIHASWLDAHGVRLMVRREDLNHQYVSGNKWWKLKYNLQEAAAKDKTILTFGGAYSNHIYATAAAAKESGLKSVGIIRGELIRPLNPTLQFATDNGMQLHAVSRQAYREKQSQQFLESLREKFGDFYLVPEGGTNDLAVKGTTELGKKILSSSFDYLFLPVGTGGTMAGIVGAFSNERNVIGVSVLKDGYFLNNEIDDLLKKNFNSSYGNWSLLTSYHHGGYAKVTEPLLAFLVEMQKKHDLPLDPVYTGKLLWAVKSEVINGRFSRGTTILALHTGGLQGALTWMEH